LSFRTRLSGRLALCALCALGAGAGAGAAWSIEDEGKLPAVPQAAWSEILLKPEAFLGRTVRLVVQFHSLEERWNPYVTRFGPSEYVALTGWTDEQRPWIRAEYDAPAVHLFVPRDGALGRLVQELEIHERIEVICVAEELFAGRPWVAAVGITKLAEYVPEGTILHAIRAVEFIEEELFELAAGELGRALDAPVPEHVRAELEATRERCTAELEVKNARSAPMDTAAHDPRRGIRRL
jgi:hypothetical protein